MSAITLNCVVFGALFRPLEAEPVKKALDEPAEVFEKEKLMVIKEEPASPVKTESGFLVVPSELSRMTKSQPQLLAVPDMAGSATSNKKYGSHQLLPTKNEENPSNKSSASDLRHRSNSGAMYRKDALYSASVTNLPEYKANPKNFTASMHRLPQEDVAVGTKINVCGCIPCEKESYDAYVEMMDFSLLKDPVFLLFTLSNFCTSIGFNVPYVYIKVYACIIF